MEFSRKIMTTDVAASYAGFFLGAGYLSGQELWQFFGVFGARGIAGLCIAVPVLTLLGIVLFFVAKRSGENEFDRVVIRFERPAARTAFSAVEMFFTFGVFLIMSAGGGALLEQMTGISAKIGSALFCAAVALAAWRGIDGMLSAFSLLVPVLTAVTLLVALLAAVKNGGAPVALVAAPVTNPLLGSWAFAAVTYLSYNFFGAVCVFSPIAQRISDRSIVLGTLLGGAVLAIIAGAVFAALAMNPSSTAAQLPMLAVASGINKYLGYVCALPLILGMFGTSLSSLVAVVTYGEQRFEAVRAKRKMVIAALAALAWLGSLLGFGKLISVVYPICGYIGFATIALLAEHWAHLKKTSACGEDAAKTED